MRQFFGLAALGLVIGLGGVPSAQAATIVVTTLKDNPRGEDFDGCTLRDAIIAANTDAKSTYCAPGNGDDEIVFDEDLQGVISLVNPLPAINQPVSILGVADDTKGGQQVVIAGAGTTRLFEVYSHRFTIANLRLTGGAALSGTGLTTGGALFIRSGTDPITIQNVHFEGNTAEASGGAIHLDGAASMTIENSVFENNAVVVDGNAGGGAIFIRSTGSAASWPKYTITGSDFIGNVAARANLLSTFGEPDGGALLVKTSGSYTYGVLAERSEFRGNMADGSGGAVSLQNTSPQVVPRPRFDFSASVFSGNQADRNNDTGGTGNDTHISLP